MMKYWIGILFVLWMQVVTMHSKVHYDHSTLIDCKVDSVDNSENKVINDTVESKHLVEKLKYSNYLDSIAQLTAPFTIDEMLSRQKGHTKYIVQDRYLVKGEDFSKWFFDRMEIGPLSGYNRFLHQPDHQVDAGIPIGVYVKYNLSHLSAFRLGYAYTAYNVEDFGEKIKHHTVDVDFMYNLSSYLYGHNVKRMMNVSAVVGGGYIRASLNGKKMDVWKGQLGLNFDFKLSPSTHLFVEPYVEAMKNRANLAVSSRTYRDVVYGVKAGFGVQFNSRNDSLKNINHDDKIFIEGGQGITLLSSDDIGRGESMGVNYRVSLGKWLDPYIGLRLSGIARDFFWDKYTTESTATGSVVVPAYDKKMRILMCGAQMEVMINVLNFFNGYRVHRHPKFTWQLSIGGEFGYLAKRRFNKDIKKSMIGPYSGIVAGTQFLFTPDKFSAIFIEPHALWANYSVPNKKVQYFDKKDYNANIYELNVGMRMVFPERGKNEKDQPAFVPHYSVGLLIGGTRREMLVVNKGDSKFPLNLGVFAGREFTPWVAAKMQVELQGLRVVETRKYRVDEGRTYSAWFNEDFLLLHTKLAFMFNFSTLYQGYRADRRMNVFIEMGPSYIHDIGQKESFYSKEVVRGTNPRVYTPYYLGKGGSWGMWGGIVVNAKISKDIDILCESWVELLTRARFFAKRHKEILKGTSLGVAYKF